MSNSQPGHWLQTHKVVKELQFVQHGIRLACTFRYTFHWFGWATTIPGLPFSPVTFYFFIGCCGVWFWRLRWIHFTYRRYFQQLHLCYISLGEAAIYLPTITTLNKWGIVGSRVTSGSLHRIGIFPAFRIWQISKETPKNTENHGEKGKS